MDYRIANKAIHDYILRTRSNGNSIFLSFDIYELKVVSKELIISNDELLKLLCNTFQKSWETAKEIIAGIPQSFGLIALQGIAAFKMHDNNERGRNPYKVHLQNLLEIENENIIQQLFEGEKEERADQEIIWENLRAYFYSLDLILEIPEARTGPGRYIQYPLSQALLNSEDLKYITPIFKKLTNEDTRLIKDVDFIKEIKQEIEHGNDFLTRHAQRLFNDSKIEDEILYKQILSFYYNWDGIIHFKEKQESKSENKRTNDRLLLTLDEDEWKTYLQSEDEEYTEIELGSILQYHSHKNSKGKRKYVILFTPVEHYDEEFEESNYLYIGKEAIICLDRNRALFIFNDLQKLNAEKLFESTNICIYKLHISESIKFVSSRIWEWVKLSPPQLLSGGLKLGRKKWMQGAGPIANNTLEYKVWRDNEMIDSLADFTHAPIGSYRIKVVGHKPIEFSIIAAIPLLQPIESKEIGWDLIEWKPATTEFNVEGAMINMTTKEENSSIRNWIELNKNKRRKRRTYQTIVNKSIQRAKYGI